MRRPLSPVERIQIRVTRARHKADKNARQRARLLAPNAIIEEVALDEIMMRDNQVCHLCGKWVSIHEASLDHVVPLSRGGDHTKDNIKLAHRDCNSKKGCRLMSEIDFSTF